MPFAGKTLLPREVAAECHKFWRDFELTKAVATGLGESAGSLGAWHDNENADGDIISRDCGLFQDNIPARDIGTPEEFALRTESKDPADYLPVLANNVERAFELFSWPWKRDGHMDIRRWEPWVAYTTGWATFPEWYTWHQEDGNPVGPWVPTGRYIHRAICGQMNYHIVIAKDWTQQKALDYAKFYAQHFGIKGGKLELVNGIVAWTHVPVKPTTPPADGVGPRPTTNDGI